MNAFNPASRYVSVLEDGLPALPTRMTPGEPVAVAVWTGPQFGAVSAIEDCEHDPYCPDDEHYVVTTYTYRRTANGWELPRGSGGTDWPGGTSTSSGLEERQVVLEAGRSGGSSYWSRRLVGGFVGPAARWIELHDGSGVCRQEVSPSGAVVVVVAEDAAPACARILQDDATVLATWDL